MKFRLAENVQASLSFTTSGLLNGCYPLLRVNWITCPMPYRPGIPSLPGPNRVNLLHLSNSSRQGRIDLRSQTVVPFDFLGGRSSALRSSALRCSDRKQSDWINAMNDLMTYSLVGYTNLNDEEEEGPTEIETETEAEAEAPAADKKLRRFLAEAEAANKEMAAIRHLLARLQQAHGKTQYSLSDPDSLRSLRRRINADLLLALRTAHHVRARLDAMDSDPEPAAASSVGAGLRAKLRALIADLQELRWRMAADHREAARCYFAIT